MAGLLEKELDRIIYWISVTNFHIDWVMVRLTPRYAQMRDGKQAVEVKGVLLEGVRSAISDGVASSRNAEA